MSIFDAPAFDIYLRVLCILSRVDPLELRPGQICPVDEYDAEAQDITARICGGETIDSHAIHDLFERWFYPNCIDTAQCDDIARRINNNFRGRYVR